MTDQLNENDAPAWALGYPLPLLKEVAGLFKREFKPNIYGAFGIPNERDIAAGMKADEVIYTRRSPDDGKAIQGAACFSISKKIRTREDFAGRACTIMPGDLLVSAIAGAVTAKLHLLQTIRAKVQPRAMWAMAHIENKYTHEVLLEYGFKCVMTKITAASDLLGIYLVGDSVGRLPPPLDAADEPGAKILKPLLSKKQTDDILGEADAYALSHPLWAQHYSSYNKRHSWTAFALNGYDASDPGFIIKPAEMSKAWKAENAARMAAPCGPTIAQRAFPALMQAVGRLPCRAFQRVRLMRLSAGGELTRHSDITDPEAGTKDGKLCRLHVPLKTSERCLFRSWSLDGVEHKLHFPERALCYLDTRKPHAVVNPGNAERIHLVVDAYSTPELRALLAA